VLPSGIDTALVSPPIILTIRSPTALRAGKSSPDPPVESTGAASPHIEHTSTARLATCTPTSPCPPMSTRAVPWTRRSIWPSTRAAAASAASVLGRTRPARRAAPDAARRLDDRYVVVVVGPDDPAKPDALDRETIRGATEHGVRFLGMRDDVDRLYRAMDLFVLPSWREGFPRAAMEAAASGLPVIASDVRGCRQVVDDGVTGLLVPVRDGAALAEAIRALGEDPDRRVDMATAAVARARVEFDERRVVDIVLDSYRRVAGRKRLDRVVRALDVPPELHDAGGHPTEVR
jgi:Glycosyl transferases group 1